MLRNKAFTLIELLIVVAIIAILAAIAVPNFLEAQVRAKVSRTKTDMRSMATALEAYAVDYSAYPAVFTTNNFMPVLGRGPSLVGAPGGPDGYAVSARFGVLTTPVAFINSVFKEAFAVGSVVATGAVPGDDPGYYDTWDYINAQDFLPGGPTASLANSGFGRGVAGGGAWRLSGVGPDTIQGYGGARLSQGATFAANQLGAPYDPTNGTLSTGDIVRVGGTAAGVEPFYDYNGPYGD